MCSRAPRQPSAFKRAGRSRAEPEPGELSWGAGERLPCPHRRDRAGVGGRKRHVTASPAPAPGSSGLCHQAEAAAGGVGRRSSRRAGGTKGLRQPDAGAGQLEVRHHVPAAEPAAVPPPDGAARLRQDPVAVGGAGRAVPGVQRAQGAAGPPLRPLRRGRGFRGAAGPGPRPRARPAPPGAAPAAPPQPALAARGAQPGPAGGDSVPFGPPRPCPQPGHRGTAVGQARRVGRIFAPCGGPTRPPSPAIKPLLAVSPRSSLSPPVPAPGAPPPAR